MNKSHVKNKSQAPTKHARDDQASHAGTVYEPSLLQAVINTVPTPIFFKDGEGKYLGCNQAFEDFVGRTHDEIVGKGVFQLWDKDLAQKYHDADAALYEKGGQQEYEAQVTYADGSIHDVVFHKAVFVAEEDNVSGIVGAILDITERKQNEAKLVQQARTDTLTGVANRLRLYECLEDACKRAKRTEQPLAVMALDLDGFKAVNDAHGHQYGDGVLQEVAQRLLEGVRETDLVARFGGDEFVIILEGPGSRQQVDAIAEKIVQAVASPIVVNEIAVSIGASIGIAQYGSDGHDVDTLMNRADKALYVSKASGKGCFSRNNDEL